MKKVFFFPPANLKSKDQNPYVKNFQSVLSQYFILLFSVKRKFVFSGLSLFKASFQSDFFILNWVETVMLSRFALIQYILIIAGLHIMKCRKGKIIWMFHNLHPHQGENKYSKMIQNYLINNSDCIITHSKEAESFLLKRTNKPVIYKCHPIKKIDITESVETSSCDILIWGTIFPYKGIYEFISSPEIQQSNFKIHIIGVCYNHALEVLVREKCNENIIYENRRVDFNELYSKIRNSKYVLFPYIGDSVSSSGALIDTIILGGTSVGPNRGAFKDLAEENLCLTYKNQSELISILNGNIKVDVSRCNDFIEQNSWESFGAFINKTLNDL